MVGERKYEDKITDKEAATVYGVFLDPTLKFKVKLKDHYLEIIKFM
jgi:hypothetical protein